MVWTDWLLSTRPSPQQASGIIAPYGYQASSTYTHSSPFVSFTTFSSCLISMWPARWYSKTVPRYDLINGIWLPVWIPEMGIAFWNTDNGWGRVLPVRLRKQHFPLTPEDACDCILPSPPHTEGKRWQEGYWKSTANYGGMPSCLWTNLSSLWLAE